MRHIKFVNQIKKSSKMAKQLKQIFEDRQNF